MPEQIKVVRNGVEMTFTDFKFLKGDRQDQTYPAIQIGTDEAEWKKYVEWYGLANIINDQQTLIKRRCQTLFDDCINEETGIFNKELFEKYAAQLSSVGGLKMKEIVLKLDELQGEQIRITDMVDWDSDTNRKRSREIQLEIKAYRQMKEDRSKKKKEDTEEAPSIPA